MSETQPRPRPLDYSEGYGELVRAYRAYMGLSQRTMAEKLDMAERSLSDIEIGRRRCPRGFIDSVEEIVAKYDEDVEKLVESAPAEGEVLLEVTDSHGLEWSRSVIGRAGVITPRIRPVLVSQRHP